MQSTKFDEMRELYFDVLVEIQKLTGVSQADVVKYDTKVFFKGDYDERLRETISKDAEEIQPEEPMMKSLQRQIRVSKLPEQSLEDTYITGAIKRNQPRK